MAKTFTRVRCPICGSMPYPGQLVETEKNRPARVEIIEMTISGKKPAEPGEGPGKGKGKGGHGDITYVDVTAEQPDLLKQWTQWFVNRVVKFGEENGYIKQ